MDNSTPLDILAIAAHPDDVEITCGGYLIRASSEGKAVGVLDLTRGEMGTYGDASMRDAEALTAAKIMGLHWRGNLSLPDSAVQYNHENKLKIAEVIRRTKPNLVILPHWEQRHPDHLACQRLGYDACFLSGLKRLSIDGEPHRPHKIIYASYFGSKDFSFLVDISNHIETKCRAIDAYQSQFGDDDRARSIFQPGLSVFDLIRTRGAALGQQARVAYAEAYTIKETILIDDPLLMQVPSI